MIKEELKLQVEEDMEEEEEEGTDEPTSFSPEDDDEIETDEY